MPSDGTGLWDIYMPHGCFKEQIVCSWCLGTILVSHVFYFLYFLKTTYLFCLFLYFSKYVPCLLTLAHHLISCLYNHVKEHNFLLKLSRQIHIRAPEQDAAFNVA
jgi:hypothetical protein